MYYKFGLKHYCYFHVCSNKYYYLLRKTLFRSSLKKRKTLFRAIFFWIVFKVLDPYLK